MLSTHHSKPSFRVPAGATDCHMHIFGPSETYPPSPARTYTPTPAPLEAYRRMAATLGLTRVVFVQASAYDIDNSCMLDAMAEVGAAARMVAGIDDRTPDSALGDMNRRGVRGVRLNTASFGLRDHDAIAALVAATARRIAPFGWHLQMFTDVRVIKQLVPLLKTLPVPVVFDHMGLARGPQGTGQEGFQELCDLLAAGRCWVKVSGVYRVSGAEPDFPDAAPIARALIAASADRVVWGTDWPHTGKHGHAKEAAPPPIVYRPLDDGKLLDLLAGWAESEAMIERILVKNPAALYGF